jgi:coiled-coil domain-containing protein 77
MEGCADTTHTPPTLTRRVTERAEEEYQEAIARVEALKVSHEEAHKTVWELHKRTGEIATLQASVSNAQNDLLEERKQLLRVIAENDMLKGGWTF